MTSLPNLIEIGSEFDTTSFMIPCYSFKSFNEGDAYFQSEMEQRSRLYRDDRAEPSHELAYFHRGTAYCVPILNRLPIQLTSVRQNFWFTTQLLGRDLHQEDIDPIYRMLRDKSILKPPGTRNTLLFVEGRRRFRLPYASANGAPKWCHRLANGERDCFSVWCRTDGSAFDNPTPGEANATRIYAVRSGYGVLYARTTTFDHAGQPNGARVEVVLLKTRVVDNDPQKDDLLMVEILVQQCLNDDPTNGAINLDDVGTLWRRLVSQAKAAFDSHCLPITPALETWRKFFLEQKAKADALGPGFLCDIKGKDWRQALDLADEASKLQFVIKAHCDSQFDDPASDSNSTATRVRRMLDAYECTPERRAQLEKMIADYVEPADELWDHPIA